MKKKEKKLIKKVGERQTPFKGFTKFKPSWDFLRTNPCVVRFPWHVDVAHRDGKILVYVAAELRPPFHAQLSCAEKTFERTVIKLANQVLEECGYGKPSCLGLRAIAEVFSKL